MDTRKTVFILGSGGRECALAIGLAASPHVAKIVVEDRLAHLSVRPEFARHGVELAVVRLDDVSLLETSSPREIWLRAADLWRPALIVLGSDQLLADGFADFFRARGFVVFGPNAAAAEIEWSKRFAKDVCAAAGVRTPRSLSVSTDAEFLEVLSKFSAPFVIKADGLALGKGVVIAESLEEAMREGARLLAEFGRILVEDFIRGEEVSWFVCTNGSNMRSFPPMRDYKRLMDGDRGPNTGGMGAYLPVSKLNHEAFRQRVEREVVQPVLLEMQRRGRMFQGLLYCGLMIDAHGTPWVLEFNARFGDPETQALLPLVEEDLFILLASCASQPPSQPPSCASEGENHRPLVVMESQPVRMHPGFSACVVLAAEGYPDNPKKGSCFQTDSLQEDWVPAGTQPQENQTPSGGDPALVLSGVMKSHWLVTGGRVLAIRGTASCPQELHSRLMTAAEAVAWKGSQFRREILIQELIK